MIGSDRFRNLGQIVVAENGPALDGRFLSPPEALDALIETRKVCANHPRFGQVYLHEVSILSVAPIGVVRNMSALFTGPE